MLVVLLLITFSLLCNCSGLPTKTKTYLVKTEDGKSITYDDGCDESIYILDVDKPMAIGEDHEADGKTGDGSSSRVAEVRSPSLTIELSQDVASVSKR